VKLTASSLIREETAVPTKITPTKIAIMIFGKPNTSMKTDEIVI